MFLSFWKNKKNNEQGFVLLIVLIMISLFLFISMGAISFGVLQQKLNLAKIAEGQALYIAEAGVNYYRWVLYNNPEEPCDLEHEDCIKEIGPIEFTDESGEKKGYYKLFITPPDLDGSTIVTIHSESWMEKYPNIKRIVEVQCGQPSLSSYSFLTNSSAWFGENETLVGKVHTNGGIRMDGNNDSLVLSSNDYYICASNHGCSYYSCSYPCTWTAYGCSCPGVWGDGPNSDLWKYPVPFVNFDINLDDLEEDAQSDDGFFMGDSGAYGYHVVFREGGVFDLFKVTSLEFPLYQFNADNEDWGCCVYKAEQIKKEKLINTYPIPDNGVIYLEDNVWVQGIIDGRATLVAARPSGAPASILINNNIEYVERDSTNSLGLIGQNHIKVVRDAPDNLVIDAIMFAKQGRVFRNYYPYNNKIKNNIEVYGSIISNKSWTWTWVNSWGNVIDGYRNTLSVYDPDAALLPPPHFPTTGNYKFISWKEIRN